MGKLKDFAESTFGIIVIILVAGGYINNIIWMLDNWSYMGWGGKALHLVGTLIIPPLGSLLGIIHFF
jgi:hypothetical protein